MLRCLMLLPSTIIFGNTLFKHPVGIAHFFIFCNKNRQNMLLRAKIMLVYKQKIVWQKQENLAKLRMQQRRNAMNTKKSQKDIRFEKEAKALQKNLAKRKKQQTMIEEKKLTKGLKNG